MKNIIMCGGRYAEWETPRQLTEINGETLTARTIRLLRENDVSDISISSHDSRFAVFGVPLLEHNNDLVVRGDRSSTGCWVNAFYPTDEPACYIMGDVVFSPDAIWTIVNTKTDGIQFFASAPPFHPLYIKQWAEPFAFKVVDQERFKWAIDYIKQNINSGIFARHPIAWELWQVINGEDPRMINFQNYIAINDYTCDIDKPEDVRKMEQVLNNWR